MTMTPKKAQALLVTATPGPWRVDGEPWKQIVWSFPDNRVCFMSHSNGLDDARDAATAELVAAAPDLARAYIAQAAELTRLQRLQAATAKDWDAVCQEKKQLVAELTRLRARIEAADKLAEALAKIEGLDDSAECCGVGVQNGYGPPECCGSPIYGLGRALLIARAALSAYEGEKG